MIIDHKILKIGLDEIKGVGNLFGRFTILFDLLSLYLKLKRIAPQIVYQNVGCSYTGVAAAYCKRNKAKLIWHVASDLDVNYKLLNSKKEIIFNYLERKILSYGIINADYIVAQTKTQKSLLLKNYKKQTDKIIPIGHKFPVKLEQKFDEICVLWIANIKPLKQPDIFIKLSKKFLNYKKVKFIMMGDKKVNQKKYDRMIKEINDIPNLTYLGHVTQDIVNQYLEKSHILVNTSLYEGFSNTFVQAWMRKVPVVSLNADPDKILETNKFGFRSGNFKRLYMDVLTLIENDDFRNDMGERARIFAKENYALENMLEKFTGLFENA